MKRFRPALCALFLSHAAMAAEPVPAGWSVVTDMRKTCQIAVPGDWQGTGSTRSPKASPKVTVTVHGLRPTQGFEEGKAFVRKAAPPIKIVQDGAKRLMYTMTPPAGSPGGSNGIYVVLNSTPVCTASFTFDPGADEALFKKIADTLQSAAK